MSTWTEELVHGLAAAGDASQALAHVQRAAAQLGFEHCAYGLRVPLSFTRPSTAMLGTYPAHWQQRYAQAGYLAQDPTVAHGLRSTEPLLWRDAVDRGPAAMWDEARQVGLAVGWCQSVRDADHCAGMLSLARATDPIGASELRAHEVSLRWLAHTAHLALGSLLRDAAGLRLQPLTPRQLEVLRWTADGKTSEDIARILGLSRDTVNYHLRCAMANLQVGTKAAAVARTARFGLLG